LVAAPPEVEQVVLQWLDEESAANGDQPIASKSYGDLIMVPLLVAFFFFFTSDGGWGQVTTTVENAELLFDTQIAEFTHGASGRLVQLIVQRAPPTHTSSLF
jgi:uncharacterized protein YndB with AHSA1/START domain